MPLTKFTASQRNAFGEASKTICNRLVSPDCTISWGDYCRMYLTAEQIEAVKLVKPLVKMEHGYRGERIMVNRGMVEGFEAQLPPIARIEFSCYHADAFIPTQACRMDNEHSQRINAAEAFVIRRAFEVGVLQSVLQYLMGMCTSVEAMRYLFPATTYFLREMGEARMASDMEEVTKRPPLPPMRPDERWRFRFINTWWAVRVLMDDFDGIKPDFEIGSGTKGLVKLDQNARLTTGRLIPGPGDEPGQEWKLYKSWG